MGPCRGLDVSTFGTVLDRKLVDVECQQTEMIVMHPMTTRRARTTIAGFAKVVDGLPQDPHMRLARNAFVQLCQCCRHIKKGPMMPGAVRGVRIIAHQHETA